MSNLSQNWTCPTTRCLSCLRSWVTASNFSVWTWVTIPSSTCQMWSSGCRRWRQFSSTTTTSWVCEFLYLSTYWFIDLFFCLCNNLKQRFMFPPNKIYLWFIRFNCFRSANVLKRCEFQLSSFCLQILKLRRCRRQRPWRNWTSARTPWR